MSKQQNKFDLAKLDQLDKKTTSKKSKPVVTPKVTPNPPTKKIGRPSDKSPDINYGRLSVRVSNEAIIKMKTFLVNQLANEQPLHKTQDSFIDAAIMNYLEHLKK